MWRHRNVDQETVTSYKRWPRNALQGKFVQTIAGQEKLNPTGVQLSERFSSIRHHGSLIKGPLKALEHHCSMVQWVLRGTFNMNRDDPINLDTLDEKISNLEEWHASFFCEFFSVKKICEFFFCEYLAVPLTRCSLPNAALPTIIGELYSCARNFQVCPSPILA